MNSRRGIWFLVTVLTTLSLFLGQPSEAYAQAYAGVWRSGTYANYYSVGLDFASFKALVNKRHKKKLRLIDLETYVAGGKRKWAGVWRSGKDANYFLAGWDFERFKALVQQRHKKKLRLVDLEIYPNACKIGCLNQVVMSTKSYNYGITRTSLHCPGKPGTCGTPGPSKTVVYKWPVDVEGKGRYVRLSALGHSDKFLTLPFSNKKVKRKGIWRYGNGDWHHAGDYSSGKTFRIRASAPGRVIHIGWDNWSGNTLVVSHNVGGVKDAYRTIYMHLRNGPDNDCEAAWSKTVPSLSGENLTKYKQHLNDTGCPKKKSKRNPDKSHWGTNAQKINMGLLGKNVARGKHLAWAGNTGPGGKKGKGGPNTHLHIFWARLDSTNNKWYFFDPYGIYALPTCYPKGVTDAITTPCARYPIAWKGGKPQYP